jgi:FkbM family methyltransferase
LFDPANYDEQLFAVMDRILGPDSSCVDVGCHQGTILREMIARAPRGRHYAFEPLPHLAAQLKQQYTGVAIHAAAVAEQGGVAEFHHVENDPAYSGLRPRVYDRPDPQVIKITVPVTTLDCQIPTSAKVALIKLDIEGGEYHALCGAENLLRRCRPFIAFEAGQKSTGQYGVSAGEMYDWLAAREYEIYTLQAWLTGTGPIAKQLFADHWLRGPEYFWLAAPVKPRRALRAEAAA